MNIDQSELTLLKALIFASLEPCLIAENSNLKNIAGLSKTAHTELSEYCTQRFGQSEGNARVLDLIMSLGNVKAIATRLELCMSNV